MGLDHSLRELETAIAGLQTGGPLLRLGVITAVDGGQVTIDGYTMAFMSVGVTPIVTRTAVYLRDGTAVVAIGMLAT